MSSNPNLLSATLGRYRLEVALGAGAMGTVYRARDPRIDRVVAVKVLTLPQGVDPETAANMRARFLNEARAAGRLNHPNIVALYDADEDPRTNAAFLAMELVDGPDLKALYGRKLPPKRVLEILTQVAAALDHAHERRVIHRDVKPANILIGSDDQAKLTDFGIARMEAQSLTQAGQFLGSPAYMSPEQVRGEDLTSAADIFSLAVVLYEGLTRRKPFEGSSLVATTHAIVHDVQVPPSTVVQSLTPALDRVLERALAKEPQWRYPTATSLMTAAAAALDQAPLELSRTAPLEPPVVLPRSLPMPAPETPAGRDPPRQSGRRSWVGGRQPWHWAALVAGAAFLVVTLAVVAWKSRIPSPSAVAAGASAPRHARATRGPGRSVPAQPPASLPGPAAAESAQTSGSSSARRGATFPAATRPRPAASSAAEASAVLTLDVFSFQSGSLTVLDGERELGRVATSSLERKGFKVATLKRRFQVSFRVPAGRRTLTFRFVPEGRAALTTRVVRDIAADKPLRATVDIGARGRDMDVKW